MRRRQFIKTLGATALGAGVLTGRAVAEHMETQPDHVTLSFDESMLDTYRPELVLGDEEDKFLGLYGWVATSNEHDTDVCVYWASYSHQEGVSPLGGVFPSDGHYGDHEPVQVEVNSDTGDVERVRASIYHWMKGEVTAEAAKLKDDTHPHLRVVSPWHQYTAASTEGVLPDVKDLTEAFPSWLENGMEEPLAPGTSTNPWIMQTRGHWWREGRFGVSTNATLVSALQTAGIGDIGSLEG